MFGWFRGRQDKAIATGAIISTVGVGQPQWTPRRYDKLAEEGYCQNIIAYRCVNEIASNAASVPWLLYDGDREIERHPVLDLLSRPYPNGTLRQLIETAIGHYLLSGNLYLEAVGPDGGPPKEIWPLRPDRMKVIKGRQGMPGGYEYQVDGQTVRWQVDQVTGLGPILHLKTFHPLNDWYGMSPIEAAARAIDQDNAASAHNAAMLQGGCRPSGALIFKPIVDPISRQIVQATEEDVAAAKKMLVEMHSGPKNAGRPFILTGDVDWREMSLSPRDMDFLNTKLTTAREICAAFRTPHVLIVPGEATYNNHADARLELWEQVIVPTLDMLAAALTGWLMPMFGADLRLGYDLDEVTALAPRRDAAWERAMLGFEKGLLTRNEAREMVGYGPIKEEPMKPAAEEPANDQNEAERLAEAAKALAHVVPLERKLGRVLSARNERDLREAGKLIGGVLDQVTPGWYRRDAGN